MWNVVAGRWKVVGLKGLQLVAKDPYLNKKKGQDGSFDSPLSLNGLDH